MSERTIIIIVSACSTIISIAFSLILTTIKNKAELKKIQSELERSYSQSLFNKRIEHYPEMYSLLDGYSKLIQYKKQTMENLREFREKVDEWSSKYSLFFTKSTVILNTYLRRYLNLLLNQATPPEALKQHGDYLYKIINFFEGSLRAELALYDTKPVVELKEIEGVYQFIRDKMAELRNEYPLLQNE
jgi:hypothetical protein